jgi:hypothetical protein
MSVTAPASGTIRLHRLTMVTEDDGVMVGRPDICSYAVFPAEGAEALRLLDAGTPVPEVAAWYQETCGSSLDVEDFLEVLGDLEFIRRDGEEEPPPAPIRWRRLGRWAFSWPAMTCYAVITLAACVAMARFPYLRPSYRHLFFTRYLSLIPVAMAAATIPLVLLHESFHALAGRRLGLPSTLTIGGGSITWSGKHASIHCSACRSESATFRSSRAPSPMSSCCRRSPSSRASCIARVSRRGLPVFAWPSRSPWCSG